MNAQDKRAGLDEAVKAAGAAADQAEAMARAAAEQGRERMQDAALTMKAVVEKSAREQPMTTVAIAAAVGFVIGALWKS